MKNKEPRTFYIVSNVNVFHLHLKILSLKNYIYLFQLCYIYVCCVYNIILN